MSQRDTAELLNLLGRAWLLEPDQPMLERLGLLEPLAAEVEGLSPQDAALAYSQAVLQLAPPYASLFLDPEGMLNSEPAEVVQRWYLRAGFEILPEWRAGPPDHLGVELLFLAWALERDPGEGERFLAEHLMSWAPVCCLAYTRLEGIALYPALGGLTLDVLLALESRD